MASEDITIEIMKAIREDVRQTSDEVRQTRQEMEQRFDGVEQRFDGVDQRFDTMEERIALTNQRLDIANERLGVVESTMLTLARRQRTANKAFKATVEHRTRLDLRVTDLEARVGRLEKR